MTAVAAQEEVLWRDIENHIAQKNAARYETALALLIQLRDACDHVGRGSAFRERLAVLREEYRHLPAFLRRLDGRALRG